MVSILCYATLQIYCFEDEELEFQERNWIILYVQGDNRFKYYNVEYKKYR